MNFSPETLEIATLIKIYVEQAAKPDGKSVDNLPYTSDISKICARMKEEYQNWNEAKVYQALIALRKFAKLPKTFKCETIKCNS